MPRRLNTHCPYCNAHHEHEVEKARRGRERGMHWIDRQRKRNSGIGNSGKFSKVPGGDKPTKRKVETAKELEIKTLDQDQFLKMLNKSS